MQNNQGNQGEYDRRDFLRRMGYGALGATAGAATTTLPSCTAIQNEAGGIVSLTGTIINTAKEEVGEFVNGIQVLVEKALGYGAVDDYINIDNIVKGRLGKLVEGIILYPADLALDIGRSVRAVLYEIPKQAMQNMEEKAGYQPKERKKNPCILTIPIEMVAGGAEFVKEYGAILIDGAIRQVAQNPLESVLHTLSISYLAKRVYDCRHRGRGKGAGGDGRPKPGFEDARPIK